MNKEQLEKRVKELESLLSQIKERATDVDAHDFKSVARYIGEIDYLTEKGLRHDNL